jgi:hypothetical protein
MKKIIYAIIITILFLIAQKIVFDLLYRYNFITGILRGPYLGFCIINIYTSVLLLFSIYKVVQYRKEKSVMKRWIPLLLFSFFLFLTSIIFLKL